jgi:inorganic pyrophosphatase
MNHPWHDITVDRSQIADRLPVVIEIPAGSKNKYELHKPSGLLFLDRVLSSSVRYPANYGFIPRSYGDDGDPLDALVLCQEPVPSLTLVFARPVGVMRMRDRGRIDDKILAVLADDPQFRQVQLLEDIAPHLMVEIKQFFIDYKVLEEKTVEVEPFIGHDEAIQIIEEALDAYEASEATLRAQGHL